MSSVDGDDYRCAEAPSKYRVVKKCNADIGVSYILQEEYLCTKLKKLCPHFQIFPFTQLNACPV